MTQAQTEVGKAVQDIISALSVSFGSTAEQVWDILIRQAVLWGWMMAGVSAVCVAFVYGMYRFAKMPVEGSWERDSRENLAVVVSLVALLVGTFATMDAISHLVNPKFHALKWLLERIPS